MSWLSSIFPTVKTAEKALDAAVKAGDAIFYTDEERAKSKERILNWYIRYLDAMQPFNTAMRVLTYIVGAIWAAHLISSTTLYLIAINVCDPIVAVCTIADSAKQIDLQMESHINEPFKAIMMFYFGSAAINGALRTYGDSKK